MSVSVLVSVFIFFFKHVVVESTETVTEAVWRSIEVTVFSIVTGRSSVVVFKITFLLTLVTTVVKVVGTIEVDVLHLVWVESNVVNTVAVGPMIVSVSVTVWGWRVRFLIKVIVETEVNVDGVNSVVL